MGSEAMADSEMKAELEQQMQSFLAESILNEETQKTNLEEDSHVKVGKKTHKKKHHKKHTLLQEKPLQNDTKVASFSEPQPANATNKPALAEPKP
jgi:hypothetical protein